jgi:hypothetical protein
MRIKMRKPLPLLIALVCGCGQSSGNPLLGDWVGLDDPSTPLTVTQREFVYREKGRTETNQYTMNSPTQVTLTRKGESASIRFKVEITGNALKLVADNGTRTFRRQ